MKVIDKFIIALSVLFIIASFTMISFAHIHNQQALREIELQNQVHEETIHINNLQLQSLIEHISDLETALEDQEITLKSTIMKLSKYNVTVTFYVPSLGGINSEGNPNHTATMEKPVSGRTIAVSRDLIHLLYKKVYIKGFGVKYCNDLLADRNPISGKKIRRQIDICVGKISEIPKKGKYENVPIAIKWQY